MYVAIDQEYIDKENGEQLADLSKKLSIMINNFIKYLKESPYRGKKYKKDR